MNDLSFDSGSFRDRTSRVFYHDHTVYRGLDSQALRDWQALQSTGFFSRFMKEGRLVQTEQVNNVADLGDVVSRIFDAVLEHETIPFISYPYEWCFGMLKDAALLHLDLLLAALDEEMILKDSTPFNMQWRGSQCVFIDIPSIEIHQPGMPWSAYRQFCQMFLYPLLLQSYKHTSYHAWLRGSIDGIAPREFANLVSFRDCFRPGVLTHGILHAKAESRYAATSNDIRKDLKSAGFGRELIKANVRGLRRIINRLTWKQPKSQWVDYAENNTYTEQDLSDKADFVRAVVAERKRPVVWDLGCNTGLFSRIAADGGSYVVSLDSDHATIEKLYQDLKSEGKTSILPLVGNVADLSPNLGWRGCERKGLVERGTPDLLICLALIHHMVLTANIPMREFIAWLASLQSDLIIEFITKDDPMVKALLRNKLDNYDDYEMGRFEQAMSEFFTVEHRRELRSGTRTLYFAKPKPMA